MKKTTILVISIFILILGISVISAGSDDSVAESPSKEPVKDVELIITGFYDIPQMTADMLTSIPDESKEWLLGFGNDYTTFGILSYKMDSNPENIGCIVISNKDAEALGLDPSVATPCKIKCDIVEKYPDGDGKYIALVENATFIEFC